MQGSLPFYYKEMIKNIYIILCLLLTTNLIKAQQWQRLDTILFAGIVEKLTVDSASHKLFVAGVISYDINSAPIFNENLAQYNSLTNTFNFIGNGNEGFGLGCPGVYFDNDTLYVGCDGMFVCAAPTSMMAIFDTAWHAMGNQFGNPPPAFGYWDAVYFFARLNGSMYASGAFYTVNTDTINGIAKWDGTQWVGLGTTGNMGVDYVNGHHLFNITAMFVYNNELYLTGRFDKAGNLSGVPGVAKWNGVAWDSVPGNIYNSMLSFGIYNGELYSGGEGTYITKLYNGTWVPVTPVHSNYTSTFEGEIYAIKQYKNSLVVAGYFDSIGGVAAKNIARFDGQSWQPLGSGLMVNSQSGFVKTVEVLDDCLYAGGTFTYSGGIPIEGVAKWCEPLSTQEISFSQSINIYPNPSTNFISLTGLQNKKVQLKIFDVIGKKIITKEINAQQNKIDVAVLEKGIYLFVITDENGNLKKGKFVKQ